MSLARMLKVLRKDLALGPRSPVFLYALVLPVLLTLLIQVVFGSLFDPKPRLGIVDFGSSEITRSVESMDGIQLTLLDDVETLKERVEANDLDGGLVLREGFDAAVRAGKRPLLEFYIGGESLASNRLVLAVTTLDLVREVEGRTAPVDVEIVDVGREALPISVRLVPVILFYAFVISGVFVPASSIVDEREKGTMLAMLVTPARIVEVLASKAIFAVLLTMLMAFVTLLLNDAVGSQPLALAVALLVAAVFWAVLGLVVGTAANDSTALFAILKGSGWFLFMPAVFYLFPDWPQWIAKLFPTFWVIDPFWRILAEGAALGDVALSLGVAAAITVAMLPVVGVLGRRMQQKLAAQ